MTPSPVLIQRGPPVIEAYIRVSVIRPWICSVHAFDSSRNLPAGDLTLPSRATFATVSPTAATTSPACSRPRQYASPRRLHDVAAPGRPLLHQTVTNSPRSG